MNKEWYEITKRVVKKIVHVNRSTWYLHIKAYCHPQTFACSFEHWQIYQFGNALKTFTTK